jgi:hypothetical protein
MDPVPDPLLLRVDPVPDPLLLRKYGNAGNVTRASGSVVKNSLGHRGGLTMKLRT